jgi:hypothetical protein
MEAELAQQTEPISPGQHEIEDDRVIRVKEGELRPFVPVPALVDAEGDFRWFRNDGETLALHGRERGRLRRHLTSPRPYRNANAPNRSKPQSVAASCRFARCAAPLRETFWLRAGLNPLQEEMKRAAGRRQRELGGALFIAGRPRAQRSEECLPGLSASGARGWRVAAPDPSSVSTRSARYR